MDEADLLDPLECRRYAEERFSPERMVADYLQAYREAIICEVYREKVFAGTKAPLVFGEPQEWLASLIEAQKLHVADCQSWERKLDNEQKTQGRSF